MRIAYLTSQYPATSHTFIRREVTALRERGLEISTFSVRPPGEAERRHGDDRTAFQDTWYAVPPRADLLTAHLRALTTRPGAYLRTLGDALDHRAPGARALGFSFVYFGEAIYLAHALRVRGVEHLHNHFANAGGNVGYLAASFLGIGWSLTLHGISEFDYPSGLLLGDKIERADFVACVADYTRAQAMRCVPPEHWPKLFVNRCGVPLTPRVPDATTPAAQGRTRILCVARLSPEKGIDGLLEAVAELVARKVDCELRLVGDGPDMERIRRAIQERQLGDRCHLTGRLDEAQVRSELASAHVFAMSSLMEGLPVVLMEALIAGVPVVAPCVAGIPELVEHNVTGLLYSPGRWDQLTDALERLVTQPALRRQLAAAGKTRACGQHDIQQAVKPIARRFAIRGAQHVFNPELFTPSRASARRVARDTLGRALWHTRLSRAAARHVRGCMIVTFHRVLPEALRRQYPFPRLAVTPSELAFYLRYFGRFYTCGTLAEVHRRFLSGERPEKPLLAITFDDGQWDNYAYALPVLQKAGLSASFFVPTGHVESGEALWHDTLGFAALQAQGDAATSTCLQQLLARWSLALRRNAPRPLDQLAEAAKRLNNQARRELAHTLARELPETAPPPWARMMTPEEVRRTRSLGHEIGSHTVHHVCLPDCAAEQREHELSASRRTLEEWTDQPVESFCYPNGDVDDASAQATAQAGYVRAVTTRQRINQAPQDDWRLGRFDMDSFELRNAIRGQLSPSLLAFRLSGWFPGMRAT